MQDVILGHLTGPPHYTVNCNNISAVEIVVVARDDAHLPADVTATGTTAPGWWVIGDSKDAISNLTVRFHDPKRLFVLCPTD